MKRVITGIAGFIGSHTAERLQFLGHTVVGVDGFSPYYDVQLKRETAQQLKSKHIGVIETDLWNDVTLDTDFDYIFHFAAQTGTSSAVTFGEYFENNVLATQKLVRFDIDKVENLKLFVNIGTSSIYGKEATVNKQVFNLGIEIESTTHQGINWGEKFTGEKINIKIVSKSAGDQLRTQAVIEKTRKVLDYNPTTKLEAGIKKDIEWYLSDKEGRV